MKLIAMLAAVTTASARTPHCHDLGEMRSDFDKGKLKVEGGGRLPIGWIRSFWEKCAPPDCGWNKTQKDWWNGWRKDREWRHIKDWTDEWSVRTFTYNWFKFDRDQGMRKRGYVCDGKRWREEGGGWEKQHGDAKKDD